MPSSQPTASVRRSSPRTRPGTPPGRGRSPSAAVARSVLRSVPLGGLALLSLLVAAVASSYLRLDPATFFEPQRATYLAHEGALLTHIGGAVVAILAMPVQLSAGVRRRWPRAHRVTGRLYVAGVAVGGAGGLALSTLAHGGPVARAGFAVLAVAWISVTTAALVAIRRGDVAAHRRWMVRSAALTAAAITLRLYLGVVAVAGVEPSSAGFTTAYAAIAWLSWVPNLAVAWWWTTGRLPDRETRAEARNTSGGTNRDRG